MDIQNVLSRGVELYFIAVFFKFVGWLVGENNYDY